MMVPMTMNVFFSFSLWFLLTCQLLAFDEELSRSSFCLSSSFVNDVSFPLPSSSPSLPWIWDSYYNKGSGFVEITVVSRKSCDFSRLKWKEACSMFPMYRNQLGDCKENNILLNVPDATPSGLKEYQLFDETEDSQPLEQLFGGQMLCVYTNNGKPVYQMLSQLVKGRKNWLWTFQIRCPEPQEIVFVNGSRLIASRNPVKWDSLSLHRLDDAGSLSAKRIKEGPVLTKLTVTKTSNVPVCAASTATYSNLKKTPINEVRSTVMKKKEYIMSVCAVANGGTTSVRSNSRKLMVEWLEYHLALGINHFFLYDVALRKVGQRLKDILTDYINEGLVTVVSWPYQSCVSGMAAEKPLQWNHEEKKYMVTFQPPKDISRHAAISSCYSRFRSTSDYIAHLDVDDFIVLDSQINSVRRKKKSVALKKEVNANSTSLIDFTKAVFASRTKAVAIRFLPILFEDCSDVNTPLTKSVSSTGGTMSVLPRLGSLTSNGVHFGHHEGKMIMRTDAVGLFHVNTITLVEKGWSDKDVFIPHIDRASIYQYKKSPEVSGNIWDAVSLPFTAYTDNEKNALCHARTGSEQLKMTKHRIPQKTKEKKRNPATYAKLNKDLLANIENEYAGKTGKGKKSQD